MNEQAWKEQAAHTVSESGAASDWEHALKIGADLYPLVQQAANDQLRDRVAGLEAELIASQILLETIDRTNSTNFRDVRERIVANRALLTQNEVG